MSAIIVLSQDGTTELSWSSGPETASQGRVAKTIRKRLGFCGMPELVEVIGDTTSSEINDSVETSSSSSASDSTCSSVSSVSSISIHRPMNWTEVATTKRILKEKCRLKRKSIITVFSLGDHQNGEGRFDFPEDGTNNPPATRTMILA